MGKLKATYNGIELPISITKVDRNIMPPMSHTTRSVGNGDGVFLLDSNFENRVIEVEYVINNYTARNLSNFRDKMALLVSSKELQRLIFSDEPNRYYDAIITGEPTLDEEYLESNGKLSFLVPDGLSHSTVEKTFPASLNSGVMEATIVNNGSKAVPVDYTIKHNHENGFIGIVSEHGTIQLGYKNEPDKQQHTKSQVLLDYRSAAAFNAMTNGQGIFGYNYGKNGTWRTVNKNGKQLIAMDAIGSGDSWHGASKMVTIPNDSYGVSGSSEFYIQGKIWFETGKTRQTGMIAMSVGDENGQHLAGIRIAKWDLGKNIAEAIFDIQGTELKRVSFIPAWDGPTNSEKGQIYIKKSGSLFEFYFGGGKYQFRYPSASSKKAKTVSIFIGQGSDLPSSLLVSIMCWEYVFFRKENVNYWVDIPNRYNGNSTVFIDGSATEVFVDGIIRYEDEMVGSDYFHVPPGETKVQFFYSDFSNPPPTIAAKIREAYL